MSKEATLPAVVVADAAIANDNIDDDDDVCGVLWSTDNGISVNVVTPVHANTSYGK